MVDILAITGLGISFAILIILLYVFITIRNKEAKPDTNIYQSIGEMKVSVSDIKNKTDQLGNDVMKLVTLLTGSSQRKGLAGETIVKYYLENLPRDMWEKQYSLPNGLRVDYIIKIRNENSQLYLPIDVKFSLPNEAENFEKEANKVAFQRAKEITKYIIPGVTTDFAVMVLPTSIYYALTSETLSELIEMNVIPTAPEGIIPLAFLTLRAHQAITLSQNAKKLMEYIKDINSTLKNVSEDLDKLRENLSRQQNSINKAKDSVDETIQKIDGLTNHLSETEGEK
ncbi:DNA recombination protein RmuC [Metallosphaera sp.]|uniref:DNA recombination protein RmuC n=1 Tax=Metallosphaera sp. TaxID=2020860 RepID=UPI0031636FB6